MTALVRGGRPDLKCLGLVPFLLLPTGEPKLEAAVGKAVVNRDNTSSIKSGTSCATLPTGKERYWCCPRPLKGESMLDWLEAVFIEPSMVSGLQQTLNLCLLN